MVRAQYEYTAEDEEELSFPEGAMIRLIATDLGAVLMMVGGREAMD